MKRCSGCGKQIRSGSMIFASDGKGGIARKRVGPCCSSKGVLMLVGSIEASRCKCGAPATTCVGCVRDADKANPKKVLIGALRKLRGIVRAKLAHPNGGEVHGSPEACSYNGEIDGLTQAIDILEGGDF